MNVRRLALAALALLGASAQYACSTLSGQVRSSAVEFSAVLEEFSNQVLVTNILRARDQSPLNFSDLPTITGAVSLKTSATLSVPFGPRNGSDIRNTLNPAVEFSSTPTFDRSSLNTQAFTLSMIQPVSPVYVESIWNSGLPKELLLYLFVESIEPGSTTEETQRIVYQNDPAAPTFRDFVDLVGRLVDGKAALRSFTVLEPMGLPFPIQQAASQSGAASQSATTRRSGTAGPAAAAVSQSAFAETSHEAYLALIQLDPSQFKTSFVNRDGRAGLQVYRRHSSQIALCVTQSALFPNGTTPPAPPTSSASGIPEQSRGSSERSPAVGPADSAVSIAGSLTAHRLLSGNQWRPPPLQPTALAFGPRKSMPADGSSVLMKGATQANGTSALLDKSECSGLEKVAKLQTQEEIEKDAERFGRVRWRSTADVFRYLGSVLRRNRSGHKVTWTEKPSGLQHLLFDIEESSALPPRVARITVNYLGLPHSVASFSDRLSSQPVDHSLEVLSLLSQLVNAAKHAEDTPTPRTLQVLP